MKNRIKVVLGLVKKDRLDAFLVSSTTNIRYLIGFEGTAGLLLVLWDKAILFVDSRYTLKAKREARGVRIVTVGTGWLGLTNYFDALASPRRRQGLRMGFEEEHLNYKTFRQLSLLLPGVLPML